MGDDSKAAPAPVGALALAAGQAFPLEVCESAAGYYIGTREPSGAPFTRESREYWPSLEATQRALDRRTWTQRGEL